LRVKGLNADNQDKLLSALASDFAMADLPAPEQAMLYYAAKLTRSPGAMVEDDVEALRVHGFDDRAIHDICAITAYFAFVNRIADGLGVELEQVEGDRIGSTE
jgi:uncharacterized peroxidase-related enzyme